MIAGAPEKEPEPTVKNYPIIVFERVGNPEKKSSAILFETSMLTLLVSFCLLILFPILNYNL